MKKIVITGAESYIGTSVEKWLLKEPDKYRVDTIDMKNVSWKEMDFASYDVVFHVAAVVHQQEKPEMKAHYLKVNRDLPIQVAKKAKAMGVSQFIFISTMAVYGEEGKLGQEVVISNRTPVNPKTLYSLSKMEAEAGLNKLNDDSFRVVVLRPPMIYGKGSKGNYPRLSILARKTPIFPDFKNERSMLHIDNLCEFIKVMIFFHESGLFFPQNKEYVNTSEMVRLIAEVHGKKVWITKSLNPVLRLMYGVGAVNKLFGNLVYEHSMSDYNNVNYQMRTFRETIELTEKW